MNEHITGSKFWDVLTDTALFDSVSSGYWSLKLFRAGNQYSKTVNDTTATFNTTERAEYRRCESAVSEQPVLETFLDYMAPDDVVYDVGANIGMFACFAGQRLESGSVVAFEPEPVNRRRALTNLARNADEDDYAVVSTALFDSDGETELQVNGGLGSGTHRLGSEGGNETVSVQTRRAETLIDEWEYPVPDVVKIDVEGAESRVLDGFGPYLSEVRTVICEVHTDKVREFDDTPSSVERQLEDAGFDIETIMRREADYHVLATRPS